MAMLTSWVITWWCTQRREDFLGAEMYFLLTLEDGRVATNDAVMNVDDGPPGMAARLTGARPRARRASCATRSRAEITAIRRRSSLARSSFERAHLLGS